MKFSIKYFFSYCDQIHSFLRIWSHLLKESLMENFIFCAVCIKSIACYYIVVEYDVPEFPEAKLISNTIIA